MVFFPVGKVVEITFYGWTSKMGHFEKWVTLEKSHFERGPLRVWVASKRTHIKKWVTYKMVISKIVTSKNESLQNGHFENGYFEKFVTSGKGFPKMDHFQIVSIRKCVNSKMMTSKNRSFRKFPFRKNDHFGEGRFRKWIIVEIDRLENRSFRKMSHFENCQFEKICHFKNESLRKWVTTKIFYLKNVSLRKCVLSAMSLFWKQLPKKFPKCLLAEVMDFFEIVNFVYCFITGSFLVESLEIVWQNERPD